MLQSACPYPDNQISRLNTCIEVHLWEGGRGSQEGKRETGVSVEVELIYELKQAPGNGTGSWTPS